MTAAQRQEELISDYLAIDDPRERFQLIVETAASGLPNLSPEERSDKNLVPGCVSKVWLSTRRSDSGTILVRVESESPALAGIATLFSRIYSGATDREILETEPEFLQRLGIDRHLTPTRLRGLGNLRRLLVERIGAISREEGP
ncbi:MAG: SufE family protein [Verrucomicrobiae bacterium]|nr:SufE family protein [Verrucomicrobiae bacterium]